jgi:hypothetical protein
LFVSAGIKDVYCKNSDVNIDYLIVIVIVILFSDGDVDFATITLKEMDNHSYLI